MKVVYYGLKSAEGGEAVHWLSPPPRILSKQGMECTPMFTLIICSLILFSTPNVDRDREREGESERDTGRERGKR